MKEDLKALLELAFNAPDDAAFNELLKRLDQKQSGETDDKAAHPISGHRD